MYFPTIKSKLNCSGMQPACLSLVPILLPYSNLLSLVLSFLCIFDIAQVGARRYWESSLSIIHSYLFSKAVSCFGALRLSSEFWWTDLRTLLWNPIC